VVETTDFHPQGKAFLFPIFSFKSFDFLSHDFLLWNRFLNLLFNIEVYHIFMILSRGGYIIIFFFFVTPPAVPVWRAGKKEAKKFWGAQCASVYG